MKIIKMSVVCALLLALLAPLAAAETVSPPPDSAYKNAKEAVSLISYGEYDMAISKLGLANVTKKALKDFIDTNCKEIYMGSVQTEVSVAWYDETWLLAVPFEAPDDAAVGALVFTLADGKTFDGMQFMRWEDVEEGYSSSSEVYWNLPYSPDYIIVGDW